MVMIQDNDGIERYSLTQHEYELVMRIKQKITDEDQEVWVCFGSESCTGVGKSLKSMQWMFPIFKELSIKQVCFDKPEFINAVLEAKKGTGVIADESISILFSRGSMTKEGRLIAELIAQIRQKNLAIFLNIPELLSLDWLAQRKLNCYVHVWESRYKVGSKLVTHKGNCAIYPELPSDPYKTRILEYMKKKRANPFISMSRPDPWATVKGEPIGETYKKPWYPVDEAAYRAKKETILHKFKEPQMKPIDEKRMKQRDRAIYLLKQRTQMTEAEISRCLEMPDSTISGILMNFNDFTLSKRNDLLN